MPTNTTIAGNYTTDEEAGAVYGIVRKLKREGYFSSYSMYDTYALLFVPSTEVDTVLKVFNDLGVDRGLAGIMAQTD